jgi:hypothetical protein
MIRTGLQNRVRRGPVWTTTQGEPCSSLEPRSKIRQFKDSRIQGFEDQGFEDQGFEDSRIRDSRSVISD